MKKEIQNAGHPSEYFKFTHHDATLHQQQGVITHAWLPGGISWFITEEERKMTPEVVIDVMLSEHGDGRFYRCSSCGTLMLKENVAGRLLFCGVACSACWAKHLIRQRAEVARGEVCRTCNKPYSACCC